MLFALLWKVRMKDKYETEEQLPLEVQSLIIKAKKEWEEIFDIISDAITIHDKDFNIIRANKAAEKLLGLQFQKMLSQKCFVSYHGTDHPPARCPSCQVLKTGIPSNSEMFEPSLNKYLHIKALPRFNDEGELIGLVHVVSDITNKKRFEDDLRKMTITDELTGIFNRRGFFTLAEQQLKVAKREKKRATIIYADLDGFKDINDKCGHEQGDNALIETADLLKESFRESDIIGRIGGDEFVIMVTETTETSIKTLTTRLKANIDASNMRAGKPYHLSLSIGMSRYDPETPCSLDELVSRADKMMYQHKRRGSTIK